MPDRPVTTAKLQEIFRVVFSLPAGSDVTTLRQGGEINWDSLAHVTLIAAIESEFNITLEPAEALRMTGYRETEALLQQKGL
jgi:acyl carrier protein